MAADGPPDVVPGWLSDNGIFWERSTIRFQSHSSSLAATRGSMGMNSPRVEAARVAGCAEVGYVSSMSS
jgi:hypothetical protein